MLYRKAKKRYLFSITEEARVRLRRLAKREGVSSSEWLERTIRQAYLGTFGFEKKQRKKQRQEKQNNDQQSE